jgi:hypothetical protein
MIQNIQIILNFNKKKLIFLKTQPQPRFQTFLVQVEQDGREMNQIKATSF